MGSDGIAVGMATKIPPHNLGEICDAIAYMIENGKMLPKRISIRRQNLASQKLNLITKEKPKTDYSLLFLKVKRRLGFNEIC